MEIEVTAKELRSIRKNKREIEKRLRDLEGLERTLRVLKLRLLLEGKGRLKKKLAEMRVSYAELVEFEETAKRDKEFLMAFRKELSEENKKLREELRCRK